MKPFFCILFLIVGNLCYGRVSYLPDRFADTANIIDDIIESWKANEPGGAMVITRGDKVIYNKGFGIANMEFDLKNTLNTVFEAGSVSKQFTAAAILTLAFEKKLSLDDDVKIYLPQLPKYQSTITIRNLLTHTSGIKDWRNIAIIGGWPPGTKVYGQANALQFILSQKTLNFEPGTEYAYSNSNYNLLVAIVEKVTGKTFVNYTTEKLFKPLGMEHTRWRDDFRTIVKDRATAYVKSKGAYVADMPFENGYGPGGLLTTTADLQKWNLQWAKGKLGDLPDSLRLVQFVLKDGTRIPYAVGGVTVKKANGYTVISHSGATAGYRSLLMWYPQLKISVVFLSNNAATSTSLISGKLDKLFTTKGALLFAPEDKGKPADGTIFKQREAIYKRPGRFEIKKIIVDNNGVLVDGLKAYVFSKDTLMVGNEKLVVNNDSTITSSTANGSYIFKKALTFAPSAQQINAYKGVFYSKEADAKVTIKVLGDRPMLQRENSSDLVMKPIYQDAFQAGSMLIQFIRTANNSVSGLSISISRAENIVFTKEL